MGKIRGCGCRVTGVATSKLVPGLFVPKTFRSQERIVPMGNFRSRDFSFPGNESSLELSFPGPFVLRNFRFLDRSF